MYSNAWAILSSVSAWPVLDWGWPGSKSVSKNSLIRSSMLLLSRHDALEHTHHEPTLVAMVVTCSSLTSSGTSSSPGRYETPLVGAVLLYESPYIVLSSTRPADAPLSTSHNPG